jgi:hypothetical protein
MWMTLPEHLTAFQPIAEFLSRAQSFAEQFKNSRTFTAKPWHRTGTNYRTRLL